MAKVIIDVITQTKKGYNVKKVSDNMIRKELEKFESAFPDGVYAIPSDPKEPQVKVRALFNYCDEKGVDPEDLSEKEMEQFLVYPC